MRERALSGVAAAALGMTFAPCFAGADTAALWKLRRGDAVEAEGSWDDKRGVFVATKIEKLPQPRRPSARGAIEAVNRKAEKLMIFRREVGVSGETVFASATGELGGRFADLKPGMRIEVTVEVDDAGAWTAKKLEWQGVKDSDKVKGTITDVQRLDRAVETVEISGLAMWVNEKTELKTDYLEEELMDSLYADEGGVNAPHMRVGDHLLVSGDIRPSARRQSGYSLSGEDDDVVTIEPAITAQVAGEWGRSLQSLFDIRLRSQHLWENGDHGVGEEEAEARQAYAVLRLPGRRGAALVVGKQRLRDGREWLFDEYLDGIRLFVYETRPVVLEAAYLPSLVASSTKKFATWDDTLFRVRYIPDSRNEASVYFLKRQDSSTRNREPIYWGLSYQGRPRRFLSGWVDAALLRGEDKGRPQRAWAVDAGATVSTRTRIRPSLTVAYAVGSGERKAADDPYSQQFRQTGYEDNSDRFGGLSNFKYYGEVLDPELSNIMIFTAGAGVRLGYAASLEAVFHNYVQHRLDDEIQASVSPELNADSRQLGRELDFVLGVYNLWDRVSMSYAFGRFKPGDAFDDDPAPVTLHRLNVRVTF